MKSVNVITIKWGTKYPAHEVNTLAAAIRRNTSCQVNFYCFTEDGAGLAPETIVKPLPLMGNLKPEQVRFAYRKEAGLCDDTLGGLQGERVFFFDLDSLIVGPLDELFAYPQDSGFYIINDWKHRRGRKANTVGQASCYSWVVGTLGYVKDYFEAHPEETIERFWTASQEYLSHMVIEREGKLNFWPDNWFKSFRFHCLPNPLLRWLLPPKMPQVKGLKMIAFHGITTIQDAIDGVWSRETDSKKYPRGWKKLYKQLKPATWVKEYWR